ncbi:MAG: asparaginase domain-containing protein, partial [Candidatus Anammoxibacter sp.]
MNGINVLRYSSVLCALILLVTAESNAIAQSELPAIHILTTGGTIASGGAEMKTGRDLVNIIPGIDKVANITIEDLFRVGSSKMTPEMWIKLIERINYLFSQPDGPDGIVITHGTDTMEETAFFLH